MRLVQHTALGILHNTTGPSPHRHDDIYNLDTHQTRCIHTTKRTGRIPAMGGQWHLYDGRINTGSWDERRTDEERGHTTTTTTRRPGCRGQKGNQSAGLGGFGFGSIYMGVLGGGCYFGPWLGRTKRVFGDAERGAGDNVYRMWDGNTPFGPCEGAVSDFERRMGVYH